MKAWQRIQSCSRRRRGLRGASALAVALAASSAVPAECLTASVHMRVQLPDGIARFVDELTICPVVSLTPTSAVHLLYADGQPVGMAAVSRRESEGSAGTVPAIFLAPAGDGAMRIVGYVMPGARRSVTYAFGRLPSSQVARHGEPDSAAPWVASVSP